ncbi:MAG: hypothetical protein OEW87_12570 [Flavobacteriaceae bacterium]|nr:hypothetical protein [Flavobacteriaceae bacterium]
MPAVLKSAEKSCAGRYRYGFNGKEKDQSGEFGGNTTYDYGFRIYNPAIGKFLSVDPLTSSYPWYTPYQFAGNQPIWAIDLDGLEQYLIHSKWLYNYLKQEIEIMKSEGVAREVLEQQILTMVKRWSERKPEKGKENDLKNYGYGINGVETLATQIKPASETPLQVGLLEQGSPNVAYDGKFEREFEAQKMKIKEMIKRRYIHYDEMSKALNEWESDKHWAYGSLAVGSIIASGGSMYFAFASGSVVAIGVSIFADGSTVILSVDDLAKGKLLKDKMSPEMYNWWKLTSSYVDLLDKRIGWDEYNKVRKMIEGVDGVFDVKSIIESYDELIDEYNDDEKDK